jgi:hypothetical protein
MESLAHLHGPNAPAIRGKHTAPNDVTAAIAIVIGVVIAIVVVIIAVGAVA